MRIFQPTFKNRKGKKQKSAKYHVSFKCHNGVWRRVTGFTDKAASDALGRKLERLAAIRAVRDVMPPDLAEWLDTITADLHAKLAEWDLIDQRAMLAAQPLTEHIEAWIADIRNRGKSHNHAELLRARVTRLFTGCGFTRYADIDSAQVTAYLADMHSDQMDDDGNVTPGASIQTVNHYIGAGKQFCRWMVKNRRASVIRLDDLSKSNADADRRYVRRPLTEDEMRRIYTVAANSTTTRNLAAGPERALVYWLVWETGMRLNEIRTLTADSFDLDPERPVVRLDGANAKNRRSHTFDLRSELAAALRLHLAAKLPGAPAFRLGRYGAKMIQADCRAAGVDIGDKLNRIDFHAQRNTFITAMGRAGVPLTTMRELARHSDIRLTTRAYTRHNDDEKRAALAKLPRLTAAG